MLIGMATTHAQVVGTKFVVTELLVPFAANANAMTFQHRLTTLKQLCERFQCDAAAGMAADAVVPFVVVRVLCCAGCRLQPATKPAICLRAVARRCLPVLLHALAPARNKNKMGG